MKQLTEFQKKAIKQIYDDLKEEKLTLEEFEKKLLNLGVNPSE